MSRTNEAPLELIKRQRSHLLLVLSDAVATREEEFLNWFQGDYRHAVSDAAEVLQVRHYKQCDVDITQGEYPRLPFHYLGIYDVCVDGAAAAEKLIDQIILRHREQAAAQAPATWLYYPVSERVGRPPIDDPLMLTLAFANSVPGQELEFREWYATRHVRHALHISALVSGQCFERSQFQRPGALQATFNTIAIYEQEGPPESIIDSFNRLPESTFRFPAMDQVKFAEWSYRAL